MKIIRPKLELVVDADNYLGETPIWSGGEKALYWVNCERPAELHRWRFETGERRIWPLPERIGGFVLKQTGGALVALAGGVYDMDLDTGALMLRTASPMEHAKLHECHCDRQGRFWVGAMDYRFKALGTLPGGGSLFRLDADRLVEMERGITCSNGLAFSPDGKRLYHSDGPTGVVHVWDLDPATGALSDKRVFVTLARGEGFCDGVTVDEEGGYWMTLVFGGKLRRYLPDGQLDIEVELPFEAPTKLAFGGPDLDTLYITTTKMSVGAPPNPMHGGVYAFKPGMRGVAEAMLVDQADVGG